MAEEVDERDEDEGDTFAFLRSLVRSGGGYRELFPIVNSDRELEERFGTEEACRDFLFQQRWPHGLP